MAVTNINNVVITGNLTADPEVRYIGSGTAVVDIGVAVNSREKQGDEWVERADFFDVTVWGRRAETIGEHLSKGSPVAVVGRLRQDRWEKDGQNRSRVKIIAREVQFLPSKRGGGGSKKQDATDDFSDAPAQGLDDDIPF